MYDIYFLGVGKLCSPGQVAWMEDLLAKSTSSFIVVGGHQLVWSICEHGPTGEVIRQFVPLLEKYNVTMWMNGHDHCNQHIVDKGVHYFTSGTAENNNPSTNHSDFADKYNSTAALLFHAPGHNGGFAGVHVTAKQLEFTQYDGDGSVLYKAPAIAPRYVARHATNGAED